MLKILTCDVFSRAIVFYTSNVLDSKYHVLPDLGEVSRYPERSFSVRHNFLVVFEVTEGIHNRTKRLLSQIIISQTSFNPSLKDFFRLQKVLKFFHGTYSYILNYVRSDTSHIESSLCDS